MSIREFFRRDYGRRGTDAAPAGRAGNLEPAWDDRAEDTPTAALPAPAYRPHGIDTPETLAALKARAVAEARAASAETARWGERDKPRRVPEPPLLPAPPPPMPPSDLSRAMVSQIPDPPANDRNFGWAREYAEYMRRVGVATGTATKWEHTTAWRVPALPPGDGTGEAIQL